MMGSLGLFAILGLVMYLTWEINWFSSMKDGEDTAEKLAG